MEKPFKFTSRENDFGSRHKQTTLYAAMGSCCCCCCVHWLGTAIGAVTGYRSGWKKAEKKYGRINRSFRKKVAWSAASGWLLGFLFLIIADSFGTEEAVLTAFSLVPILFLLFPAMTAIVASYILEPKQNSNNMAKSSTPTAWLPCLWMFIHAIIGMLLGYPIAWVIAKSM